MHKSTSEIRQVSLAQCSGVHNRDVPLHIPGTEQNSPVVLQAVSPLEHQTGPLGWRGYDARPSGVDRENVNRRITQTHQCDLHVHTYIRVYMCMHEEWERPGQ